MRMRKFTCNTSLAVHACGLKRYLKRNVRLPPRFLAHRNSDIIEQVPDLKLEQWAEATDKT